MSAISGRDGIIGGELQSDLDGKGYKIINADISELLPAAPTIPTIATTVAVLKGDNAGNAIAATAGVDFWQQTIFSASGLSHGKGLVPDPGASAGTTKFLREDSTFAVPPGLSSVASTSSVLKGNGSGNAVAATAKTDFWDTTVFVASGASHAKGLVPDPGASAATTKYLREDSTWAVPPAASGVTIAATTNLIKGDGAGGGIAAVPGTDYISPTQNIFRLYSLTTVLSGAAPAIDWSATTSFSLTLSVNCVPTFSNVTDGQDITIAVTNTGSNYTITWPAGIKWQGGAQPTQTVGAKTDVWSFKRFGSITRGAVVANQD